MKITAIVTVRNEGAFLLEWLAHHRAVGFSDFLVFSNDCQDGTDAMLDRLAALGWLTHMPNPGPHAKGPQWQALAAADRHPLVRGADWLMHLDIDEFLNIHTGDGRLPALLSACPGATGFALTWRMFGNGGVDAIADRPVAETFLRAAPEVLHWPWRAQLVKTLFANDGSFGKLGVHRPRNLRPGAAPAWVDGSGRPLPPGFVQGRVFTDPGSAPYALAQINHYALGSMQGYLVKADRGRANREAGAFDLGYWVDRNFADVEDRTILRMAGVSAPLRAALHADPVLGPLHRAAVDWRRARFAALMAEEPWRALYGRLKMTPPSRALPPAEAEAIRRMGAPPPR
jgi:hypothetical protein